MVDKFLVAPPGLAAHLPEGAGKELPSAMKATARAA